MTSPASIVYSRHGHLSSCHGQLARVAPPRPLAGPRLLATHLGTGRARPPPRHEHTSRGQGPWFPRSHPFLQWRHRVTNVFSFGWVEGWGLLGCSCKGKVQSRCHPPWLGLVLVVAWEAGRGPGGWGGGTRPLAPSPFAFVSE